MDSDSALRRTGRLSYLQRNQLCHHQQVNVSGRAGRNRPTRLRSRNQRRQKARLACHIVLFSSFRKLSAAENLNQELFYPQSENWPPTFGSAEVQSEKRSRCWRPWGLFLSNPAVGPASLAYRREPDKLLKRWHYASKFNEHDVYELRLVLEPRAALLAAKKITSESLAELTASLAKMKDNIRQGDLLAAAHEDFRFHDIIVRLSTNRLFQEIHHMNRNAILESQKLPLATHKRLWEPARNTPAFWKHSNSGIPTGPPT